MVLAQPISILFCIIMPRISIPLWFSLRRAVLRCSSQIMDPSLEEEFLVPTLRVQVPRSWFKTEERAEMPDQVRHDGKGLSSRSTPILSSRSAPIRDLVLTRNQQRITNNRSYHPTMVLAQQET